jgi:endo-1,4-beta-D-glucanase Y
MKLTLPSLLVTLLFVYSSATAQDQPVSFAVNRTSINPIASVSKINCTITNHRVLLSWNIVNNQQAQQIEVESATDGKNFHMIALVFGTEKQDTDDYFFYEKAKQKKTFYRLKIINKDKSFHYSDIITP